jgi:hypothetical protein
MYRRFFTGATSDFDGGWALSHVLGNTPEKFAGICSGMPGPLQLLPTNNYRDEGGQWLHYKLNGSEQSWSGDVYDLYLGGAGSTGAASHDPPAITPSDLGAPAVADLRTNTRTAQAFHAELGRYQHPKTKTIHSTGLDADMAILFDPPKQPTSSFLGISYNENWKYRGAQRVVRPESDGTVPRSSADVLKPNVEVSGVEHSAACNDGKTRDYVKQWIEEFLA